MFEKTKKYKNIFFDIFDTVLSRKIEPEYTKKLWCNQIIKIFGLNMNMEDLYNLRNKTEFRIGEENHNKNNDYEFKYEDLIKGLYESLNIEYNYKDFYNICEETEINIESDVLYPNEDILDLIKKNYKTKNLYCVSDMYLSKKMIKKIFINLGIDEYFKDYYMSCEYLKNKKSGILYDIVLKDLKVSPEECIMIGDNKISDYETPKNKGIESIHLNRQEKYDFYSKYLSEKNIDYKSEIIKLSKQGTNSFENTIFSLYRFIEKIYYNLIREKKEEVFFLSREGEYLKKLFDYYVENIHGKKIKSNYLLVSRKSTYIASLKELPKEDFSSLLNQYSYVTINEFLSSLNFTDEEIAKIKDSYKTKIDFEKKIGYFNESKELSDLKKNKTFKTIYEKNRKEQKDNFKKYISELTTSKDIVVVDIGWNGSIQNNIENILGSTYKVTGYYFGLQKKYFNEKNIKYGLMFTNYPSESREYYLFNENRSLFEILLGASHGSANKYVEKNKKIEVELFKKDEEEKIYKNIIKPLQDEMFFTFKKIDSLLSNSFYNNLEMVKLFNKIHYKMLFKPSKEQLTFFNKIYHYENFGVFQITKFNNEEKMNLKGIIKENIKFFKNHQEYMYDSFWPTLKLNNKKLVLQKYLYRIKKYRDFKKNNII